MPAREDPELHEAYLSAVYRARDAAGRWHAFTFVRDGADPGDDPRAIPFRTPWAIITAWNPRSERRSPEANRAAQARLLEALAAAPGCLHRAEGRDAQDPPGWIEESVLVEGIERGTLLRLLRQFEQNAAVYATPAGIGLCFAQPERFEARAIRIRRETHPSRLAPPTDEDMRLTNSVVLRAAGRDVECPHCGYNLRDTRQERCPECGKIATLAMIDRPWVMPRSWFVVLCYVGLTAWMAATLVAVFLLINPNLSGTQGDLLGVGLILLFVGETWLMVRWVRRPGRLHLMPRHLRPWAWLLLGLPGIGVCVGALAASVLVILSMAGVV